MAAGSWLLVAGSTIVLVFGRTIAGLVRQWTSSPDASYGLVLAAVALAVSWKRRGAFVRAQPDSPVSLSGLAFLTVGLVLYAVGQLGADVFLTRVSMVAIVTGTIWFAGGETCVRAAAAPLVFLLIAIPLPELVVNAVTLPLQFLASKIAEQTITAAGVAVFRDGNVLELPSGSLEVAQACSGLRSAVSLAAIAVLLAWTQPTWPKRAALVAASVPIAILMNGLRITATAFASEAWGPATATGPWHELAGWATFAASVAVLMLVQRAMGREPAPESPAEAMVSA